MNNALNWFEIPVVDFDRAVNFYGTILDQTLHNELFSGTPNAFLPFEKDNVGGSLVHDPQMQPSQSGTIVYLNVNGQLDAVIARIEPAGGRIVLPKTNIGEPGEIAKFIDSEGNLVGLHSETM